MQRCSNAFTISFETCPKNVAETVACIGFANAKARSRVTNVGPSSGKTGFVAEIFGWYDGES
jgi:hypothetical protein